MGVKHKEIQWQVGNVDVGLRKEGQGWRARFGGHHSESLRPLGLGAID